MFDYYFWLYCKKENLNYKTIPEENKQKIKNTFHYSIWRFYKSIQELMIDLETEIDVHIILLKMRIRRWIREYIGYEFIGEVRTINKKQWLKEKAEKMNEDVEEIEEQLNELGNEGS